MRFASLSRSRLIFGRPSVLPLLLATARPALTRSKPRWAVLIPLYNAYILLKVARRPGWWLLLYLIPVVNIVIVIIVAIDVARNFGRSAAFGFFLNFLLFGIGDAALGFGSAQYQRVVAFAATR